MGNLAGWPYWKVISITGQSGAGVDYQVELEIGDSAGGDYHLEGHCTNFPQDIRITDNDGTTLLDYFVEDLTADPIIVLVEVKDNLDSNQDIIVYYGKSGETTASNAVDTYIYSEDFEYDDAITNHGWTINDGTPVTSTTQAKWGTRSLETIGNPTERVNRALSGAQIIEFSFYDTATSSANAHVFYFADELNAVIGFNGYGALSDTEYIFYKGGSTTNFGTRTIGWHDVKVVFDGTKFNMWFDGTLRYVDGTYPLTKIRIEGDIGGNHYTDGIRTRKYNSPEPTFSSAGAEQTPIGVSPTSVFYGPLVGPFGGPI